MFSTYEDTIDYLFNALPAYQRIGGKAMKIDLSNIERLCAAIGDPHKNFQCIHVAGTNGKGSVSHMLAAALARSGYKTGLYTSPHYLDFRERVRINGQKIMQEDVIQFVNRNHNLFTEIRPSFFEMTVAMAFDQFSRSQVDVAVIETGLGGRLDSTNIVTPLLSVITNVGFDHMDFLGDTLPQIAREKAGIIKHKVPLVLGKFDHRYADAIYSIAEEKESPLRLASEEVIIELNQSTPFSLDCHVEGPNHWIDQKIILPVGAHYQLENLATTISALSVLKEKLPRLTPEKVVQGLENFVALTAMMGRFQILSEHPHVLVDGGHNPEGIRALMLSLQKMDFSSLHIVLGFSKGKKLDEIIALLPSTATYYLCAAQLPRALAVDQVADHMTGYQRTIFESVKLALAGARNAAAEDDLILITGSIFVVAEALEQLGF